MVRKVQVHGDSRNCMSRGAGSDPCDSGLFFPTVERAGTVGKNSPESQGSDAAPRGPRAALPTVLVRVNRVQQPTATGILTSHACRSQSLNWFSESVHPPNTNSVYMYPYFIYMYPAATVPMGNCARLVILKLWTLHAVNECLWTRDPRASQPTQQSLYSDICMAQKCLCMVECM